MDSLPPEYPSTVGQPRPVAAAGRLAGPGRNVPWKLRRYPVPRRLIQLKRRSGALARPAACARAMRMYLIGALSHGLDIAILAELG